MLGIIQKMVWVSALLLMSVTSHAAPIFLDTFQTNQYVENIPFIPLLQSSTINIGSTERTISLENTNPVGIGYSESFIDISNGSILFDNFGDNYMNFSLSWLKDSANPYDFSNIQNLEFGTLLGSYNNLALDLALTDSANNTVETMLFIDTTNISQVIVDLQTLMASNALFDMHTIVGISLSSENLYDGSFEFSEIELNTINDIDNSVSVSEPGTLALLGLGLAGFGYRRKVKK